jgi:hypothetical protein
MVHLILGITFGFWALQLLFFTKLMLHNIIFKIKIIFIIYIEGSMGIYSMHWYNRAIISF